MSSSTGGSETSRTAIVFDYDWSLINCNSDTYVFEELWPERPDVVQELARAGTQWTRAVDQSFRLLQEAKPEISQKQIYDCVARVPVQSSMLDAIGFAAGKDGCTLFIVSDANTAFIEAFLKHHDIKDCFEKVISNVGSYSDNNVGRFEVRPYLDFDNMEPAGCRWCPPNMCKGDILTDVLQIHERFDRVLYIGDGGGDFCPCTRLRKNEEAAESQADVILARRDPPPESEYGLTRRISKYPGHIKATVREWSTGKDILEAFQELL